MKKCCLIFMAVFSLTAAETGMKPRAVRRQKTGDIRRVIGDEFEKMLTSSSSLIASLSDVIQTSVSKIKQIVSGEDNFFAQQTTPKLVDYKNRLKAIRIKLETTLQEIEKELKALKKDFELGKE